MITRIARPGGNPARLVSYLTRKEPEKQRLLDSNLIGGKATEPGGRAPRIAEVIEDLNRAHRPTKGKFVKHMILSFPPEEKLPERELRKLTRFYLKRMGYEDAPFAAYLHTDRKHPHIHIVTTPTTFFGERISEDFDARRSQRVAREIEREFNLQRVPMPREASFRAPKPGERELAARTGEAPARTRFQLDIAKAGYASRTMPGFVERVETLGYRVYLGVDRAGKVHGSSFEKDGHHFKGSQLGQAYKGNQLVTSFQLDYVPSQDREALLQALGRIKTPNRAEVALSRLAGYTTNLLTGRKTEPPPRPKPPAPLWPDWQQARQALAADRHALRSTPARPAREMGSLYPLRQSLDLPVATYWLRFPGPYGWRGAVPHGLDGALGGRLQSGSNREDLARYLAWTVQNPQQRTTVLDVLGPHLSFRNLTREQVQRLRRDGIEPALRIQRGDRFDVLIRADGSLTREERGEIRSQLVKRYDLRAEDGIRASGLIPPGAPSLTGDPREAPKLVEVRTQALSASREMVRAARKAIKARELAWELERVPRLGVEMGRGLIL